MVEFDFKFWSSLASQDPQAFESLRKQFIEYEIQRATSTVSNRLFGLQFQIDMERRRSACAMGSCIKISEMMMDYLYGKLQPQLNGFLNNDIYESDKNSKNVKSNIVKIVKND